MDRTEFGKWTKRLVSLRTSTKTVAYVAPLCTGPNNTQLHFKTLCKEAATKWVLPILTTTAWFLADTNHPADKLPVSILCHFYTKYSSGTSLLSLPLNKCKLGAYYYIISTIWAYKLLKLLRTNDVLFCCF